MMKKSEPCRRPLRGLVLCVAVGALLTLAWAAGHTGYAAEKAIISSDKRSWGDTNKGTINFEGNVSILFGDMRITCQAAEIDADGKTGKLTGSVVLIDKGVTIKADSLEMNLQKRQGLFKGKVTLVRDEEKSSVSGKETVTKERVEVACDQIDANTSKRTFTATGSVKLVNSDFTATCDTARFDEKAETMVMTGKVLLVRKEKEQLAAGQVEVDLKAKRFAATDAVELSFEVEEEGQPSVTEATTPESQPAGKEEGTSQNP